MPQLKADMSYTDFFKARTELVKALADNARSYIQISSAALALPFVVLTGFAGRGPSEIGALRYGRAMESRRSVRLLSGNNCVRALLSVAYCSASLGQASQGSHHCRLRRGMGGRTVSVCAKM